MESALNNFIKFLMLPLFMDTKYLIRKSLKYEHFLFVNFLKGFRGKGVFYYDKHPVFIHLPKNAGSSIRNYFVENQEPIIYVDHGKINPRYKFPHELDFKDRFVFTTVRNPFDRLVSAYHFLQQGGKNKYDKQDFDSFLARYGSFERFVRDGLTTNREQIFEQIHLKPQTKWIQRSDGSLCVPDKNI